VEAILIAISVLGYAAIALEHPLKIDKAAALKIHMTDDFQRNMLEAVCLNNPLITSTSSLLALGAGIDFW